MIGDWAIFDGTAPRRTSLSLLMSVYHGLVEAEPIPLTPEILTKNNFVDCGDAGFQRLPDKIAPRHLTIYTNGPFSDGVPFRDKHLSMIEGIKHVHTLQQALRICGLDELADNFVV